MTAVPRGGMPRRTGGRAITERTLIPPLLSLLVAWATLAPALPVEALVDHPGRLSFERAPALESHTCGAHEKHIPLETLPSSAAQSLSTQREALPPCRHSVGETNERAGALLESTPCRVNALRLKINALRGPPCA